jgi:hypothetical protein
MTNPDEDDFRWQVYEATKGAAALSSIGSALTYFCRVLGETTEADVHRCVQLVWHLEKERTQNGARSVPSEQEESTTHVVQSSPTSRVASQDLVQRMQSWLEELRHALTGSGESPAVHQRRCQAGALRKGKYLGHSN